MSAKIPYSDRELLLQIRSGDENAFRILYGCYWNKLLSQAFFVLRSKEEAEEIVQEVFLDIWKRRTSLKIQAGFYTYASAMTKYHVLQRLAGRRKVSEFKRDTVLRQTEEDHSTTQWLSFEELKDSLEATVSGLPEKCRLVFRLSREEGLSEKQIASALNISVKTVEAHISKALKTLRISLHQFLGSFFW